MQSYTSAECAVAVYPSICPSVGPRLLQADVLWKRLTVSQSRTGALEHWFSYAKGLGESPMGHPKRRRQIDTSYFLGKYVVSIQATTAVTD